MGKKIYLKRPKVIVLRACGTNCDIETENAFKYVGAYTERVHINELVSGAKRLDDYDIIAIPGGFSFGDDISGGKIFALRIKVLMNDFKRFIESKRPVIGICNGFQVLVKAGLLPYSTFKQVVTLYYNDCGHFVCRWVRLRLNKESNCIFTKGLPLEFSLPVAHGEGKLICDEKLLKEIIDKKLVAIFYSENLNGSLYNIAGLTNEYGNVFGLMPHPERAFFGVQSFVKTKDKFLVGFEIFKNAVDYVR